MHNIQTPGNYSGGMWHLYLTKPVSAVGLLENSHAQLHQQHSPCIDSNTGRLYARSNLTKLFHGSDVNS